jgi:hypothetical protein
MIRHKIDSGSFPLNTIQKSGMVIHEKSEKYRLQMGSALDHNYRDVHGFGKRKHYLDLPAGDF